MADARVAVPVARYLSGNLEQNGYCNRDLIATRY